MMVDLTVRKMGKEARKGEGDGKEDGEDGG